MSDRIMTAALSLLLALNAFALSVNLSRQSRAETEGMNYQKLMSDSDFVRAVKSIAEACTVNVDIAKLKC
jgi:hypothetical protein